MEGLRDSVIERLREGLTGSVMDGIIQMVVGDVIESVIKDVIISLNEDILLLALSNQQGFTFGLGHLHALRIIDLNPPSSNLKRSSSLWEDRDKICNRQAGVLFS